MHSKVINVTVKVSEGTMVSVIAKEKLLTRISNLQQADQERILKICENPKALKGLADNWSMLQSMFL